MILAPTVRLAVPADAAPIAEMSRRYIEQGLGWSWTAARVLRSIGDDATNVAVARQGRRVLGFGIMQYGDQHAHLALLAVELDQRQRGVGAQLLAWLEHCARVAGLQRIRLEARRDNAGALAFYEGQGYRRTGIAGGYYLGVLDAVRLEKTLVPTDA